MPLWDYGCGMARQGRTPRILSRWPIVGALAGWAILVVVGAGPSVDDSLLGVDGLDDVWAVILFAAAFVGLIIFIYLNPFTRTFTAPDQRRRRSRAGLVAFILLLVVIWRPDLLDWLTALRDNSDETVTPEVQAAPQADVQDDGEGIAPEVIAQASDVLMLVGALVFVAAVWWLVRSRMTPELLDSDTEFAVPEAELAGAVGQAALALDAEDDPRLAVLKAYAILERILADHDVPRSRTETPREHLQRALAGLAINTSSLLSLADLYELARFSERPITVADRSRAATLLDDAQRELRTSEVR